MWFDNVIIIAYLLVITGIGIQAAGKVKSLKDFSISDHKYSIFALLATLSASFIGGGFSTGNAAKVAQNGIVNIVAICGFSLSIILVGKFIVPKIVNFANAGSTGEIMKQVYGKPAQIITGIFSLLVCAGILGAQVGAIGYMFNVFLGIGNIYGILIGCAIVIIYSTFGGMRAVVTTDIIQFVLIFIGVPILLYYSVNASGGLSQVIDKAPSSTWNIFDKYSFLEVISLFLTLALGEALVPPYVQRLLMGKDVKTTAKATIFSGILSVPFFIVTGFIGIAGAVYFAGQSTDMNAVMPSMIKEVIPIGWRGLIIAAMLSIVMSSADSFLNSASVAVVTDIVQPLSKHYHTDKAMLRLARLVNLLTGTISVVVAVMIPNILDILMFAYTFWSPVILVPLAAAMLGIKSRPMAFYAAMAAGAIITIIWTYVLKNPGIDGTIAGVAANLITFTITCKVFTKQPEIEAEQNLAIDV